MNGREVLGQLAERIKGSWGRYRLVWLVILAGLILLLLPTGGKEGEAREEVPQESQTFDLAQTEARLSEVLSKIDGAGEVTVMLTVENGPRQVLAQDVEEDTQGREKTETVVLSRGSNSQETVIVQEVYPRYQGALLVCGGGNNPTVRLQLTQATAALTGLGADKISISKGK